jgi:hypothetical protein
MQFDDIHHLIAYGIKRVQGSLGILKDHGDLFAPDFPHILVSKPEQKLGDGL